MFPESEFTNQLNEITKKTIYTLDAIWAELGLDDDARKSRKQLFSKHVQDLYSDMIKEAEACKTALEKQIDVLLAELTDLGYDLRFDISIPVNDSSLQDAKKLLESQLKKYGEIYEDRKAKIKKLDSKQKHLCKSLGKECRNILTSPLPTEDELHDFKIYLEELSDLKFQREEIFLKKKSVIIDIMNELKIVPSLDLEREIVYGDESTFLVTDENMAMLEELHSSLVNQLEQTRANIAELRACLDNLWKLLEESPEAQNQFLNAHPGNCVDTLKALKIEIARCKEKKKENIKLFVEKMRQELIIMWNKCCFCPDQKAKFIHFESDCYTEDLLTLHEIQIEKVKNYYEKNKNIFELVTQREQLWEKMIDLEQRANQPNRYQNRGGQLLREERERKIIASKLPKVEQELMKLVEEYERKTGDTFLIYGSRICNIIESAWEEYKENKHITLSAKKHARENSRLTPCRSRIGTPRLQLRQSPITLLSTSKRKINTPNFGNSKRTRIYEEKLFRTAPSKLQVNGSIIRRASLEKKRKIERYKKQCQARIDPDNTLASIISDYVGFEQGLQSKPTCRSSLFSQKNVQNKIPRLAVSKNLPSTPRRVLKGFENTPQRTPSKLNLRSRSPAGSNSRLATAPGTLPIII